MPSPLHGTNLHQTFTFSPGLGRSLLSTSFTLNYPFLPAPMSGLSSTLLWE